MSDEYFAVILEFNPLEVKLGFAGESTTHVRLTYEDPLWSSITPCPTLLKDSPSFLGLSSHALEEQQKKDFLSNITKDVSYRDMISAFKQDEKDRKFFDWSADRYKTLSRLLKILVPSSLLISPHKAKLLVLDHELPLNEKYFLCEAILDIGAAVSVCFLPFVECAAIGAGVDDALVLLVQWNTCILAVVLDLRRVEQEEYQHISGEALHYGQVSKDRNRDFLRIYQEGFFTTESLDRMLSDEAGLVEKTAQAIKKLSIDLRGKVSGNVVICGKVSDMPGFKGRVLTELASRLPGYDISGKECLGAWAGASLYCSTSLLKESYSKWTHVELTRSNLTKDLMREVSASRLPSHTAS